MTTPRTVAELLANIPAELEIGLYLEQMKTENAGLTEEGLAEMERRGRFRLLLLCDLFAEAALESKDEAWRVKLAATAAACLSAARGVVPSRI